MPGRRHAEDGPKDAARPRQERAVQTRNGARIWRRGKPQADMPVRQIEQRASHRSSVHGWRANAITPVAAPVGYAANGVRGRSFRLWFLRSQRSG
jgi:hypothetical protein